MSELEMQILGWIKAQPIGPTIMGIPWVFPTLETLHFIGICLLFGSLLVVDLRLLGFLKAVAVRPTLTFLWVTVGAFLLLLATGLGFIFTNPFNYWLNPVFRIKLLFIFLGGVNAVLFTLFEHRKVAALGPYEDTNALTKTAAFLSLAFWTVVLFCGRSLPLFDTGQG